MSMPLWPNGQGTGLRRRRLQVRLLPGARSARPFPRGVERQARPAVTREIQVRVLAGELHPRHAGVAARGNAPARRRPLHDRRGGFDPLVLHHLPRATRGPRPVAQRQSARLTRGKPRGSTPAGTTVTEAEEVEAPDCGSGPSRCESGRSPHTPPADGGTPQYARGPVAIRDSYPQTAWFDTRTRDHALRAHLCSAVGLSALSRATAPRTARTKPAGSPVARAVT